MIKNINDFTVLEYNKRKNYWSEQFVFNFDVDYKTILKTLSRDSYNDILKEYSANWIPPTLIKELMKYR